MTATPLTLSPVLPVGLHDVVQVLVDGPHLRVRSGPMLAYHRLGIVRRALPATAPDQGNRPPRAPDDIAARPALALVTPK